MKIPPSKVQKEGGFQLLLARRCARFVDTRHRCIILAVGLGCALSACEQKANTATTEAIARQGARIDKLEMRQQKLEVDLAKLSASTPQWILWRQHFQGGTFATKPVAEDAFADKEYCQSVAKARLESEGGDIVALAPITGRFRDRVDRMYCLPTGASPLQ